MPMAPAPLVLPRPKTVYPSLPPIPAPSEASFIAAFGALLPPASYLHTPHGRAAYYSLGPSHAPPQELATTTKTPISRILLVHGVQTSALGLQPLAARLSTRYPTAQIVLLDLWGHGLTDTPLVPHEPSLFHGLIEALMLHLAWEDAHLVGYSFGGSTVVSFAAAAAAAAAAAEGSGMGDGLGMGRVSSLVLIAPAGLLSADRFTEVERGYLRGGGSAGVVEGEGGEVRERKREKREEEEAEAARWVVGFLEGGELVVPPDWKERVARGEIVAEAVREWQIREHAGHAASVVGIFRDGGVLDKHPEFSAVAATGIRSFCVLGELDDVCRIGDLIDVGMSNVVVIGGVGHGVVRERVGEVAGLIEGFWDGL